jgi:putative transposase
MAPQGLTVLLATEVPSWSTTDSAGTPTFDPHDGTRQTLTGRGAHRQRVAAGKRRARLAAYDPEVSARVIGHPARHSAARSALATFLKNHAAAIIACDFCEVAATTFRLLYVLIVIEHASRRIIHLNATAHPTAAWTLQQLREVIPLDHTYRFILHDHDPIFSSKFDTSAAHLGLTAIQTPVQRPQANALCERLIGTLRRECLDLMIPLSAEHLRRTLRSWLLHCNCGRPHSSLGPGLPEPPLHLPVPLQRQRHRFDRPSRVVAHSVLNGLHHEYRLLTRAT